MGCACKHRLFCVQECHNQYRREDLKYGLMVNLNYLMGNVQYSRNGNVNLNTELQNNIVFVPTIFACLPLNKPTLLNSSRNVIRRF